MDPTNEGVSRDVLDRLGERKNSFSCRMYGLVDIMSRTVFARMDKKTSVYKDLLDQLVEQIFGLFRHELDAAWRDGWAHRDSSLHQCICRDDLLDSEIESESVLINGGVGGDVLDRLEERKHAFLCRMYGLVDIMSRTVFARMDKKTSVYKDLLDQLVEQIFGLFRHEFDAAWRDGWDHRDSSLHQCICRDYLLDSEIVSESESISEHTLSQEELFEVVEWPSDGPMSDEVDEQSDMREDDDIIEVNDEYCHGHLGSHQDLSVVNGQITSDVDDDREIGNENEELNEHRDDVEANIDELEAQGDNLEAQGDGVKAPGDNLEAKKDQFDQNIPIAQVIVSDMSPNAHICQLCGIKFASFCDLFCHNRSHAEIPKIVCPWKDCGKAFPTNYKMKLHLKCHTDNLSKRACKYCGQTFISLFDFAAHKRTHLNKGPYVCPLESCARTFTYFGNLRQHLKFHNQS